MHHFVHLAKDRLFSTADIGFRYEKIICGVLHGQHAMIVSRSLTGLAGFPAASPCNTKGKMKKYIATGRRNLSVLQRLCKKGNPDVQHFVAFLRAEKSFCKCQYETALGRYRQATGLAARSGFNHDHALACERLACLHLAIGDKRRQRRLERCFPFVPRLGSPKESFIIAKTSHVYGTLNSIEYNLAS